MKISLMVQDPVGQIINRTKAILVDITIRTGLDDFINLGTSIYLSKQATLKQDLESIGLELIRAEVINFKLPDKAREQYAKVMGESREMQMEIDRLKIMRDKGVIGDYMKLKLIEGLSNSNFPPMQMYAMQMLNTPIENPKAQSDNPPILPEKNQAQMTEGNASEEQVTGIKPGTDLLDEKGTLLKRIEQPRSTLTNIDTGKVFAMQNDLIQIGRAPDNDIVLNDSYASRKHAQIIQGVNGELILINLSSNNPIKINGDHAVESGDRVTLNQDDVIEIGYSKFKVHLRVKE